MTRTRPQTLRIRRFFAAAALTAGVVLGAALPAAAEPALWKLEGAHATVYLFGTVHTLRPQTNWRSPKVDAAFSASKTLYEELENTGDQSALQALVAQYGLDPSHPLSGKLDAGSKAKLDAVASKLGAPVAQLDTLRPWTVTLVISSLSTAKAGFDPNDAVDLKLKALASEQGKAVAGFETMEQQIRGLADLPEPVQIQMLLAALDEADKGAPLLDQVVAAWTAGDLDRLEVLTIQNAKRNYPEAYARLFVDRNQRFAAQIETLLKGDGVYFVAIGAGHLVGPDSVQADLSKDGVAAIRQ
jgi:uncharacterized protein